MNKITSFYVFVTTIDGEERILMIPDSTGQLTLLAYTSKKGIEETKVRQLIEDFVREHKVCFELREYKYALS